MKTYKWDAQYDVGFKPIDGQHKSILHLINRLIVNRHKNKKIIISLLDELLCYIQYHFKSEENYMLMYQYSEHESHLIEHAILVKDIIELSDKFKGGKISLKILTSSLLEWAMSHILEVDKIVGRFLAKATKDY